MNCEIYEGKKITSSTSVYEVEEVLDRGGYGQAVQCRNERTQEAVVVKIILDNEYIEGAEHQVLIFQELKALGSEKVNIVKFHESFTYNGHFCLKFERLNMNLRKYCGRHPLSLPRIRHIRKQVAEALWFLNGNGYIHRDIKPDNIMVVDHLLGSPEVKVIDFGMRIHQSKTWKGMVLQTLSYIAPEVLMGAAVTQAIDVWSLGCLAAELLTGELLFPGDDEHEMMDLIISTIGMPPWDLLRDGLCTQRYFVENRRRFPPKWTESAGFCPFEVSFNPFLKLQALLKSSSLQLSHDLLKASSHPTELHSTAPPLVEEVPYPGPESPLRNSSGEFTDHSESGFIVVPHWLEEDAGKGPREASEPTRQVLSANINL